MNGAALREARGGSLKNFRFALRAARCPGARGPGARWINNGMNDEMSNQEIDGMSDGINKENNEMIEWMDR